MGRSRVSAQRLLNERLSRVCQCHEHADAGRFVGRCERQEWAGRELDRTIRQHIERPGSGRGVPRTPLPVQQAAAEEGRHLVPVTAVPTMTTTATVDKREMDWTRNQIVCSAAHVAVGAACIALLGRIRIDGSWKSGGPRDICYEACCISWSANATFQIENLYNDAERCYSVCVNASGGVSCEAYNVSLQGTIVNQCLSNRPNGCA